MKKLQYTDLQHYQTKITKITTLTDHFLTREPSKAARRPRTRQGPFTKRHSTILATSFYDVTSSVDSFPRSLRLTAYIGAIYHPYILICSVINFVWNDGDVVAWMYIPHSRGRKQISTCYSSNLIDYRIGSISSLASCEEKFGKKWKATFCGMEYRSRKSKITAQLLGMLHNKTSCIHTWLWRRYVFYNPCLWYLQYIFHYPWALNKVSKSIDIAVKRCTQSKLQGWINSWNIRGSNGVKFDGDPSPW